MTRLGQWWASLWRIRCTYPGCGAWWTREEMAHDPHSWHWHQRVAHGREFGSTP